MVYAGRYQASRVGFEGAAAVGGRLRWAVDEPILRLVCREQIEKEYPESIKESENRICDKMVEQTSRPTKNVMSSILYSMDCCQKFRFPLFGSVWAALRFGLTCPPAFLNSRY